jgi:VanZ family protein
LIAVFGIKIVFVRKINTYLGEKKSGNLLCYRGGHMGRWSQKFKNWLVALGYLGFIYATLGVVRIPVAYLRSHGLLRVTLAILYGACVALALSRVMASGTRAWWRYAVVLATFLSYLLIVRKVRLPEEQIHFFEYGFVGVFFFRALALHFHRRWEALVGAFFMATAAGWLDECLQGITPGRHYDAHDILLNAVSASLGLFIYMCIPFTKKEES